MVPSPSPIPGPLTQAVSSTDGNNKAVSYQASQPRNSMSVTNTKGLLNMPGQNNCFLNSAVQVLWHLDIFRRSFRELSGHACMAESCIFCALKELFAQFQYSHESALPPDALRQALAKTFCDQRRFQLGFMDDAAECFENILLRIHVHIASQGSEDMCGDLRCIPHQKFAMTLVEQLVCHNCGRRSEPLPFTQMVHYVATSALCAKAQEITTSESECFPSDSFGKLLKLAGEMGEVRKCPGECGSKINVKKTLMNHPEIVSVGLVWDSECPSIQHITDVFCNIGTNLQLQDMFHAVVDCEWARTTYHHLVGVVTYYGKHYSTFFFHSKLRVWIYFDDATVREIGPSWEQVVEKCQRGHFQPLLLLFATPDLCSIVPPSTQNDKPVTPKKDLMESGSTLTPRQAVMQQYNIFMNSLQNGGNVSCRNTHMSAKHCTSQENYLSSHYPENDGLHGKSEPSSSKCFHCGRFLSSATCVCSPKQTLSSSTTSEYANLPPSVFKHFSHDSKNLSKLNETALPFALPIAQTVRNNTIQKNLAQSSNSPKSHPVFNASMPQGYNPEFETKETASLCKTSSLVYGEGDPDSTDAYISRKAVENVLHLQKIQQHQISLSRSYNHGVAGNRNSSSSLESFDNAGKLANKTEREPHTMHGDSIRTRRDSGNWSSDHNSSSSLSTTSENCFFPATPSKKTTLGLKKLHSPTKAKLPDYSCVISSDHGYDSYSVSSSDSYPSVGGSPIKLDPHLTRIPEDLQGPSDPEVLNKKLQIITEESTGPPDCDKLCAEADLLLAKSHDKEKEGDLIMAALLSDSAAARARAAMEAPYNNPHSLVSAKMKHSTCVMRSSCLYRRIKDDEIDERRKQKGFSGHHSRQSSRDSTHSRHSHQNNKDKTHSKHSNKGSNQQVLEESEAFGKNVEIYGTLPKKGSRRKLLASPDSTRVKDEQVYKDFLDKQRKNISICNNSSEDVGKSGKSSQKVESVKSKSEHSNEKLSNRLMHGCASPKSPTYKKQDISLVTASEDPGSGTNIVKRSSPKQTYPSHLFSSHLTSKNTDVSCDDVVHDGLLSPVNSSSKKQHKIKRKLIGGFMKQKNRSLPDLREDQSVSDSLDRSFDDTSLQMSPTLMLPNGTLKKLECQTDSARSTVPRGFHQPHYAFIKKDLSHRPLLVKVNPPNVQASVLNNSKSKLMRTLPSLPRKYESNTAEINHKPSKIPFASFVPKKETSAQAPLSPLKSLEILPPPTVRPLRNSSIPILTQQSVSMSTGTKSVIDTPTHPVTNQASAYFSEDLPPPSNPFLAELQARRRQIIGQCEKKKENAKANEVISEPQPRAPGGDAQSQLSEFCVNNEGVFWLQELQFKQHQMLQKPNSQVKPLFRTEKEEIQESESKELNAQTSESLASVPIPKGGEPEYLKCPDDPKPATVSSSTLSPYAKNSGDTSKCSPKIKNTSSSSSSVKDLASRFEKVLNKTQISNYHTNSSSPANVNPQSQTSSENHNCTSRSTGSSGACDQNHSLSFKEHIRSPQQNERTTEMQLHVQKQKTSEPLHSPQAEENECKESVLPPIHDACINESEPKATLCESGIHPSVRPQQPPDYETALQRLEFIRTAPLSETPEGKTLEELKLPSFGISSDVPAPVESSKRKQGPKKTVTFSDKVVLVACADFEDDFLPNPLLERVYQQHSETGGSETLDLCISSDFSSNYPNENALVPCDTIPCAAPRPGGEMKLTSQSVSTSHGSVPCHLCHTKYVTTPTEYCTDCEFYMSRFRP